MTFQQARAKALRTAKATGEPYFILGPCPTDGYWIANDSDRRKLWLDRKIVFTARP